jgi:hypothetical protein
VTLDIHLVVTPDVSEVLRLGPAHPVLGGLWEIGTIATLPDVTAEAVAAEAGGPVRIVGHQGPLTASLRDCTELRAAAEPVIVVLFPDPDRAVADVDSLLIVAGPDLPILGRVETGSLDALRDTILLALGQGGRGDLFAEPDPGVDVSEEVHLSARLRQLYGE